MKSDGEKNLSTLLEVTSQLLLEGWRFHHFSSSQNHPQTKKTLIENQALVYCPYAKFEHSKASLNVQIKKKKIQLMDLWK